MLLRANSLTVSGLISKMRATSLLVRMASSLSMMKPPVMDCVAVTGVGSSVGLTRGYIPVKQGVVPGVRALDFHEISHA
jgi:hypothetical protein